MRPSKRLFARLALIGAVCAGLTLAACGRKGPLDPLPGPGAAAAQQPVAAEPGLPPSGFGVPGMEKAAPTPDPTPPNKRLPIDVLVE